MVHKSHTLMFTMVFSESGVLIMYFRGKIVTSHNEYSQTFVPFSCKCFIVASGLALGYVAAPSRRICRIRAYRHTNYRNRRSGWAYDTANR